ncbi:Rieske (2Fe-2S) protein [Nitrospirillum sp. BR 11163]|uniref:Rieske (2Fe-2S) protein n=1 Tax=Nitrospirillum sp. BR 11163 TaxID=3104323 RepID=UPI002AFF6BB5|nr:Rieske (2Fe-2S) protein [Nitrospirillum sp. BR 11163]MEA1673475.1 Rieske (2Fe-2S) protein [Nitrospirillum sp. BR 11163]
MATVPQAPGESTPGDAPAPPPRTPLCPLDALPPVGHARGFDPAKSGRDTVFALRRNDGIRVYHNHCPHQGVPLEYRKDRFLSGDGQRVLCYAHGAHFDADSGLCTDGPCRGMSLTSLPLVVEDGWLYLALPPDSPVLR